MQRIFKNVFTLYSIYVLSHQNSWQILIIWKNIYRQNPVCGYQNHLVSNLIYNALICSRWMRTDIWLWNGPNPSYHINSFERYKDLSSEWRSKVEHKAELQVSRKSVKEACALCITQPDLLCWGPVANGNIASSDLVHNKCWAVGSLFLWAMCLLHFISTSQQQVRQEVFFPLPCWVLVC